MGKVVVIDGPAGSGKSTTAKLLADKLGFSYLDTGAMYRAMTVKFIDLGFTDFADKKRLRDILAATRINLLPDDRQGLKVLLDGRDVSQRIRSDEVDSLVSKTAAEPLVREYMQARQREFAERFDTVAEGRDLGTYVFPNADVKIFLVADLEVRAKRRMLQKNASTEQLAQFRENLAMRDRIDSSRKHSPLKKAADAIEIDTTNLTIEQQVEEIYKLCRGKLK